MIKFGPAGNSDSFYEEGYKTTLDVPRWLYGRSLNAYEYQCTRGVRINRTFSQALAVQASRYHIALSIHAPYYINLASPDPAIQESSKQHLIKSLSAAKWMGATRVVFHPGAAAKLGRTDALQNALTLLEKIISDLDEELLEDCFLCPETMGKANQLGTVAEVLELCKLHPKIIPAVDFGHIHALGGGCLKDESHFIKVLEKIAHALGEETVKNLHVHFAPVEYTAAGEKKHCTLKEKEFGPDFYPFAKVIAEKGLTPTIICESAGTQAEDAAAFLSMYNSLKQNSLKS
ncbi:TIM barrel protein [Candidatus Formimonas warabiya]|uniref:Endonuclease IV n=1 Tax=Formimonas warabiya TaxID=1761012 RepID=A0A3G1KPC9_FORW1|nr:TIM barrel protein [Candidatus Formimonas warabiya]ATW24322.1 endonuclease IV [Candidatus Formimonas warabiya]